MRVMAHVWLRSGKKENLAALPSKRRQVERAGGAESGHPARYPVQTPWDVFVWDVSGPNYSYSHILVFDISRRGFSPIVYCYYYFFGGELTSKTSAAGSVFRLRYRAHAHVSADLLTLPTRSPAELPKPSKLA